MLQRMWGGESLDWVTKEILGGDEWSCKVNVGRGFEGFTREMLGGLDWVSKEMLGCWEGLNAVTKEISVIWNIKLKNDIGRVTYKG